MQIDHIKVWTALVTPFCQDGRVDYDSLAALVDSQSIAGNGIILFGSTGEGLALSWSEKSDILQYVLQLNLDLPVLVGVSGHQLASQIQWCQYAQYLGAFGFMMVTPMYAKPGIHGQISWFGSLLAAVDRPCMFYNVPRRTGSALHPEVIKELADKPNMWAIKDSGADTKTATQFCAYNPKLKLFCGDDPLMPDYARVGAVGCVSVAANIWPQATAKYINDCLLDQLSDADHHLWQQRSKALFVTSNPIAVKAGLHARGMISSKQVRSPLSTADMPAIEQVLLE